MGEGVTKVLGEADQELTFACDFADCYLEHELARGASGSLRSPQASWKTKWIGRQQYPGVALDSTL